MKWITRERPKIDRLACPWLIRHFIDKEAEFLYVPKDEVLKIAKQTSAIPYDIPGVELASARTPHLAARKDVTAFILELISLGSLENTNSPFHEREHQGLFACKCHQNPFPNSNLRRPLD